MTVGELKELLSQYPDYYPVTIRLVDDGLLPDAMDIVKTSTFYSGLSKTMSTFKTTSIQADAWNCTLLEMGMMPKSWVDKLETYYRLGYRRTDFHDEFFATYNDMRALLKVPNRFRAYVGQMRDIGLPKRKLAVI